ncbi:MAG: SPASM domain-containing protein [Ruminococcaceae bacterium]|nr:SPASM domain-containing protein [Oscillospiraceae bacterium]
MKYKNSIYNVVIPTKNAEKVTIWNTRTGSVVRLYPNVWEAITLGNTDADCVCEHLAGLSSQGIIIPNDFDEYNSIIFSRRVSQYASSKTFSLIIAPTLGCNFHCVYCFEKGRNDSKIMDAKTQDGVLNFVESQFMRDKNISSLSVTWFGGEPLIGYKSVISPLSTKLIALCEKYNIAYNAGIITNGYYLNSNIIPDIIDNMRVKHYQITLDGPEAEYCDKKKATPAEFKTVIDNIFALSSFAYDNQKECDINIRINVDKSNYNSAKELVDILTRDSRYKNNIFFYLGKIQGDGCICYELNEFENAQTDFEKFTNSKLQNILPTKCVWCDQQTLSSFCIGPEGELYKCERNFGDKSKVVGNVFSGLNYSEHLLKFFDPSIYAECKSCKLFPVCLGGCPTIILEKGYDCVATLERAIELVRREFELE